jgi:hypothetical protein
MRSLYIYYIRRSFWCSVYRFHKCRLSTVTYGFDLSILFACLLDNGSEFRLIIIPLLFYLEIPFHADVATGLIIDSKAIVYHFSLPGEDRDT